MATQPQPQGLNVPSIIVIGLVGVILTMTVVEGVRAYYYHRLWPEEEAKYELGAPFNPPARLRREALDNLNRAPYTLNEAMKQIAASNGKLPDSVKKAAQGNAGTQSQPKTGKGPQNGKAPAPAATTGAATTRPSTRPSR